MKKMLVVIGVLLSVMVYAQPDRDTLTSGNPLFPGWYADPEATIFGNEYWIYPTYSAPYDEQVFLMPFPLPT